jgi:hypothetical protein
MTRCILALVLATTRTTVARTRQARRLLAATLAALAVGATVLALAIAAMDNVRWDPRATVILSLAAMWIPQALLYAQIVHHRRREPRR